MERKKWRQQIVDWCHCWIKRPLPLTAPLKKMVLHKGGRLSLPPATFAHLWFPTTMASAGHPTFRKSPAGFFRDEVLLFPPRMSLAGSLPLFQDTEHSLGAFKHLMTSVAESSRRPYKYVGWGHRHLSVAPVLSSGRCGTCGQALWIGPGVSWV